jgi:hypothetical protein
MVFIEPSIFTQIGGSQSMRRSKQLDYELESRRRASTAGAWAGKIAQASSRIKPAIVHRY